MKRKMTRITLSATVALLTAIGVPIFAQAQEGTADVPNSPSSDQTAPMTQCYQAMHSMQKKMMARHQAMNARLDQMMAAVQKAQGDEKIAAMEALLGELVDQTKSMHGPMMMGMGMHGTGMMGGHPMTKGHPMSGGHGMMKHDCPMGSDCPMMKDKPAVTGAPEAETPSQQQP